MDMTRQGGAPPALNVFGSGDHATAISLFAGIMTALYRREKTGEGARVTASLIAEGAWAAGCWLSAVLAGASNPRPVDRLDPPNALGNVYRTADDRWLLLAFANEDKEFPLFLKAIGHPEAADDPRFADSASRHAHATEIVALLDKEFAARPAGRVARDLRRAGLTYGVVQTLEEAAHDPQFVADEVFVPVEDGSSEPYLTIDSPVQLDQEQKVRPRRAPDLGEHTQAVLSELGFDAAAIERAAAAPGRSRRSSAPSSPGQRRRQGDTHGNTAPPASHRPPTPPPVQTHEADGVFVITINRPKVRNAVDGATAQALAEAFDQLDARDDLAVGVLTGAGGTFSAGMDLKAYAAGDTPVIPGRGFAGLTRARPRTPLIAAVEGWALGGGTEMALACDLIVAAQDATLRPVRGDARPGARPRVASFACPNASPATSPWNCCSPVTHCPPCEPSSWDW